MRTRLFVVIVLASLAMPSFAADKKAGGGAALLTYEGARTPEAILSFSWGVTQSGTIGGGGGGAGKASFQDFTFTKGLSALSTTLFNDCATGKHIKSVTIQLLDGQGKPVATITLSDVLVSSYQMGSSLDGPVEAVSLSYAMSNYILIGL